MTTTMSQKAVRESLGNPELFEGGVYVTKNGTAELFIQPAIEREAELAEREYERQQDALFRTLMRSKQDFANNRKMTPEEALRRLNATT
ncbi:hypothetical protein SNQ23_000227 [Cronobacter dublinensis]|uniref:hypothetical protein n=1 Tax=Cronobacter dublinensis TaxID=413497 RepID=UPI0024ADFE55|nr:hypothetical protein [Cronobacter dublinensis]ELY6210447.1 hypothetical protein [Cronobacter dublinensis]EMD9247804.1 hypothetical protein [Cronobacter dublinensis]MDI6444240.1 hypothetical protein [Cronobacter dublinensis]MDK1196468.1 hypothetical protein [Cronobacter dublinensis]